jgi:hypothetical protein
MELVAMSQASLEAIARLSESTATTLENVQSSYETTFTAIKTAITADVIGFEEALVLWKAARRKQTTARRDAELINLPCSYVSTSVVGHLGTDGEGDGAVGGAARVGHRVEHSFVTGGVLRGTIPDAGCGTHPTSLATSARRQLQNQLNRSMHKWSSTRVAMFAVPAAGKGGSVAAIA